MDPVVKLPCDEDATAHSRCSRSILRLLASNCRCCRSVRFASRFIFSSLHLSPAELPLHNPIPASPILERQRQSGVWMR